MKKIKIIAEAGVNHNGNISIAKKMIVIASNAGADSIKFQSFKAEELVTKSAPKAPYQLKNSSEKESQFDMLKKLELSDLDHFVLKEECKKRNIEFLSTPFDMKSLKFLTEKLKLNTIKIPSGEITNLDLIFESAKLKKKLIVSTGMSNLEEIKLALSAAAFGYTAKKNLQPSLKRFKKAYLSTKGKELLSKNVTLLHCTSDYPAKYEDLNLKAIKTLRDVFGLKVGYSDHSLGTEISISAVAMGAQVIEKHFTLSKKMDGPDHLASLEPDELSKMINSIRNLEKSFGNGIKNAKKSELKNRKIARKSIVAAKRIKKGDSITKDMLKLKRPEIGLKPEKIWDLIGTKAIKNYKKDEIFK